MSDSDGYGYEFTDSDAGSGEEEDEDKIKIENTFYEAEEEMGNPAEAIKLFEVVNEMERDRDMVDYRFKALKHIVILSFRVGNLEAMNKRYEEMLSLLDSVTTNEITEAIDVILDTVSTATDISALGKMYTITLETLKKAKNERLWFSTNVKLGKLYLTNKDYAKLRQLIRNMQAVCQLPSGEDDPSKGTSLMEVYALEIQLCTATHNPARMQEIFASVKKLNAAVTDPRIMGTIHESFGVMHMAESRWQDGYNEFFDAVRNYQEAGNPRAKICLRYVVLASMVSLSQFDPFATREAKVYMDDPVVRVMVDLRAAYDSNDIDTFERLLRDPKHGLLQDELIMRYIAPLLANFRSQVLLKMVRPYKTISLEFLAEGFQIDKAEIEELLVGLILDGKMGGRIDQVAGVLIVGSTAGPSRSETFSAISDWTASLEAMNKTLQKRLIA